MLDHVPYLPLHGNAKQCYEIHNENGPKDRNIKHFEERTHERNERRLRDRMPELELGQAPNEWSKLLVTSGG